MYQRVVDKRVVDIVCKSGLPYRHSVDCKTTPPARETIKLFNELIADPVPHSDWSSAVHGLLVISRRSLPTRGFQPYAGRSLHHKAQRPPFEL